MLNLICWAISILCSVCFRMLPTEQAISVVLSVTNNHVIIPEVHCNLCIWFVQLMETSGTDILNDSDVRAPVSPLHLSVSNLCYPCPSSLIMALSSISSK